MFKTGQIKYFIHSNPEEKVAVSSCQQVTITMEVGPGW